MVSQQQVDEVAAAFTKRFSAFAEEIGFSGDAMARADRDKQGRASRVKGLKRRRTEARSRLEKAEALLAAGVTDIEKRASLRNRISMERERIVEVTKELRALGVE